MPHIDDDNDPELAALKKRTADAYTCVSALHEALKHCSEEEKLGLRGQHQEARAVHMEAYDAWLDAHYARGDYSIPKPE